MSKNILFIFGSIFFITWILINNITSNLLLSLIVLLFIVVLFLCYFLYRHKHLTIIILTIMWITLWIIVSEINLQNIEHKEQILVKYYNNQKQIIRFEIQNTNKIGEFKIEYIAKIISIWEEKINSNIKAIVKFSKNNELKKWQVIESNIKIYEFKDFEGFAYKKYMLSKNLFFTTNIYSYEIIWKNEINVIEKSIINIRQKMLDSIYEMYPKEEAIFLWGILLWAREYLPEELKQDFNNSWLTHFIAVSGFNITVLIVFITYIIKYLPNIVKLTIITVSIILFTILVWFTAPVIRAAIMGVIWYYILTSWRKQSVLATILFTLVIMISISPLSVNYDVSLHLSFFAVLWIIYTQKFFEKIFHFLPNFLEIKTAFTLTLSALSFTLPIMILNFGQVSILAPLANIAVTWSIPLAMLTGFISLIVYFVHPFTWIISWYATWILLKWNIIVVHFFGKQEWAVLKIDFWIYKYHLEILYFAILVFLIIWFRKKEED